MNLKIKTMFDLKSSHLLDADKIAESIFNRPPVVQQEMLEQIKKRLYSLNKNHLEKIGA